jgi:hypothetical protein
MNVIHIWPKVCVKIEENVKNDDVVTDVKRQQVGHTFTHSHSDIRANIAGFLVLENTETKPRPK